MILNLGMVDKIIVFICVLTSFFRKRIFRKIRGFPTNVLGIPKFQNGKIREKKERLKNYL